MYVRLVKASSILDIGQLIKSVWDRQQKNFGFLSRLCLLRGAGGQDKSAKNRQFPDESLLL